MKHILVCLAFSVAGTMVAKRDPKDATFGVVLAGGSGERLWPLSRSGKPKQLLTLGSEKTLLEQSVARLRAVEGIDSVCVTSAKTFLPHIAHYEIDEIFVEPAARNTGPAVLYSCLKIYERHPMAIALFTPSDAYILQHDTDRFAQHISQMVACAREHGCIAMLGVPPTYAATGYGYIEYAANGKKGSLFCVTRFHEKPSHKVAQAYLNQPNMLWNIGIFAAPVSVIIEEFTQHAPDMVRAMQEYMRGEGGYENIPADSVDYAVMEHSTRTWVLPVDFAWSDVGTIETFLSIKCAHKTTMDNVIQINARNNLVDVPKRLVALVGVDDLCVVETDDALVITKRSEVEKIREVVGQLKKNKQIEYL